MKSDYLLYSFVILLSSTHVFAQQALSGYVYDERGEAVSGALVYLPASQRSVATNAYGFFSMLAATADSVLLQISYPGHKRFDYRALPGVPVNLVLQSISLREIEVRAQPAGSSFSTMTPLGVRQFSASQLAVIPTIGGESDLLKALALTPGVSQGVEGTTGILVRGGTPDQNLILLDGTPVYNVSHAFGFLSVFNTDAIRSVDLLTGGFPARYGGRLSSIIDVHLREGSKQRVHGKVGLGLVASKVLLEGPLWHKKASFIVSGRTSTIGLLTWPMLRAYNNPNNPSATYQYFGFNDVNIKYNHVINPKNHIFISFYTGNDRFVLNDRSITSTTESFLAWGNNTAVLRHTLLASDRLFIKNSLNWSRFRYEIFADNKNVFAGVEERQVFRSRSGLEDFSWHTDAEYIFTDQHFVRAGMAYTYHTFDPQISTARFSDTIPAVSTPSTQVQAFEVGVYVEDEWQILKKWILNYGLRYNVFRVENTSYHSLQPRFAIRYAWKPGLSLRAGYDNMQQNLHLLSNNGFGLPNDIWVPVTRQTPPQRAQQLSVGVVKEYKPLGICIGLDGYYKRSLSQIDFQDGANFLFNLDQTWQDVIERGGLGRAYGAELFFQKNMGRLTGMFGYTLAWSNQQFSNINGGKWYPGRYDRRHDVEISAIYPLSKKWQFAANWVFQSGQAITLPTGSYPGPDFDDGTILIFSSRNGSRLPPYHRADVSLTRTKPTKRWKGEKTLGFQVYNIYNRRNPFFIETRTEIKPNPPAAPTRTTRLIQRSLLPVLPSATWSISF